MTILRDNGVINIKDYGAIGDGNTDDTTAIQNAINAAASGGKIVVCPPATYLITNKVQISTHFDGRGAEFKFYGTSSIAVEIAGSGSQLANKVIYAPKITQSNKTWGGTDTGLKITSATECEIHIINVNNFSTGVYIAGSGGNGNAYNNFFLTSLENNKVNLLIGADDTASWANQNTFIGGRFWHYSNSGTGISGCRHISISNPSQQINNNTFLNASLEGDCPDFYVTCYGVNNYWQNCRYEPTASAKFWFRANGTTYYAQSNAVMHGFGVSNLSFVEDAGCLMNHIYSSNGYKINGNNNDGVVKLQNNSSSNNNALTVYDVNNGGLSPLSDSGSTSYAVGIAANRSMYKRRGDSAARLQFDHLGGNIYFGDGTTDPTTLFGIASWGGDGKIVNKNLQFDGTYNGSHIVMYGNHIWYDSSNKLRMKTSAPTTDKDGTLINGQTVGNGAATVATAGTSVQQVINFGYTYPTIPYVLCSVTNVSNTDAGYINVRPVTITTSGCTVQVNSYIAQTVNFSWIATL